MGIDLAFYRTDHRVIALAMIAVLAFTLSMAIGRWDARRAVLVDESNANSTLWLRAGFSEQPVRDELRTSLRAYNDTRISRTGSRDGLDAWAAARKKSRTLHEEIWSGIERAGTPKVGNAVKSSLITAANAVIDIHELRLASIEN